MEQRGKILIIEDDVDIRELLTEFFESEKYEVACAVNGQDALNHLEKSETLPDVILLDLMMPVLNGWDFRSRMEKSPKLAKIPIIVMTADGSCEQQAALLRANGNVRKPIELRQMMKVLEKALVNARK